MKVKSLHLKAYGIFTDAKMVLSTTSGVLNVIHGHNEKGKSTARRAVGDLLYGIPHNTPNAFLHEARELRVGAELLMESGEVLSAYRRKGRKDTLLDVAGVPLDETQLHLVLSRLDREAFERMFALDSEQLRFGGNEMVAGRGEAGPIIFAAGAGLIALNHARKGLEEDASELLRGRSGLIPLAVQRHRESLEAVKRAALSGEQWAAKRQELERAALELSEAATRRRELEARRATLERIRRHLPQLARRTDLGNETRAFGALPDLPERAREERIQAERALDRTSAQLQSVNAEMKRLREQLGSLTPNECVLRARTAIACLAERRGAVVQDANDLVRREAEFKRIQAEISVLLKETGHDIAVEAADDVILTRQTVASIRQLIQSGSWLSEQIRSVGNDLDAFTSRLRQSKQALANMPGVSETSGSAAVINEIIGRGPLEKNLGELRRMRERDGALLDSALKRLGLWTGSASDLADLPMPSQITVERFTTESDQLARQRQQLHDEIRAIRDQIDGYERQLVSIETVGSVVTEADVAEHRRGRDRGWALVRRGYIDQREDVSDEAACLNRDLPLPEAYEVSVTGADQAVDQLRAQAKRAAEFKTLSLEADRSRAKMKKMQAEFDQVCESIAALQAEWYQIWLSSGIEALLPAEMNRWLNQRDQIVGQLSAIQERDDSIRAVEFEIAQCRQRLNEAVTELGAPPISTDESLCDGLTRAQATLERLARVLLRREALVQSVADSERLCDQKGTQLSRLNEEQAKWRQHWANAIEPLRCAPEADSAGVEALLDNLEQIREGLQVCHELLCRIEGIRERIDAFDRAVRELAVRLFPEMAETAPLETAECLIEALSRAEQADQDRRRVEQELKRLTSTFRDIQSEMALYQATLDRQCRAAGCTHPEELEQIEQRVARNRDLANELGTLERALVEDGEGNSLIELVGEAEGHNSADLTGVIGQLLDEINMLERQRRELSEQKGRLETELGRYDAADAAAAAAQQAEFELAAASNAAVSFICAKVAAAILSRAVDRFSREHQVPILKLAGELFSRLTLNSFASLSVEPDENDHLELLAIRPSGEKVPVGGLSDGTRDQLYLALRVAAILDYLDRHEALPVIADDLLISFDDERSAAALEVLAILAQRTQVLLFTHHAHVVEQAQTVLGPGRATVVELLSHTSDEGT